MINKEKTMAYRLLKFIGENPKGLTLTAIQYYIWVELEGKSIESFFKKSETWGPIGNTPEGEGCPKVMLRSTRGHWCTNLYGGDYYHNGLLKTFCKKIGKRWVLVRLPKPGENLYQYKRNY